MLHRFGRSVIKPHRAHHDVGIDGGRSKEFREPPLNEPARQFHLPEPVLRVRISERKRRILERARDDVRDGVTVAQNLHRLSQAGDGNPAAIGR